MNLKSRVGYFKIFINKMDVFNVINLKTNDRSSFAQQTQCSLATHESLHTEMTGDKINMWISQ